MSFASNNPGIEVVRIATFPLRATMLPGAGFPGAGPLVDGSVAPACIVEFDARPGRSFIVFWFVLPLGDEPAPDVAPIDPDVEPIEPVGPLELNAESPTVPGGLLVPLVPSEPKAGATDWITDSIGRL